MMGWGNTNHYDPLQCSGLRSEDVIFMSNIQNNLYRICRAGFSHTGLIANFYATIKSLNFGSGGEV